MYRYRVLVAIRAVVRMRIMNQRILNFDTNSIVRHIIKYISTEPVSGSRNVIIEGIMVIIRAFVIRSISSFALVSFVFSIIFAR